MQLDQLNTYMYIPSRVTHVTVYIYLYTYLLYTWGGGRFCGDVHWVRTHQDIIKNRHTTQSPNRLYKAPEDCSEAQMTIQNPKT